MTTVHHIAIAILVAGLLPAPLSAQGKGEGGIVLRDGAPVYGGSTTKDVVLTLPRGASVAGVTTIGLLRNYHFEEDDGRVHVVFYKKEDPSGGMNAIGWMLPEDIARFTFDCGCDTDTKRKECSPMARKGWGLSTTWNACFKEARDIKLAELKEKWEGSSKSSSRPATTAEKALTNDDVISMIKADLGDEIIIKKIETAQQESLDTSADGLVKLKRAGASKAVIAAIMKKTASPKKEVVPTKKESTSPKTESAPVASGKILRLTAYNLEMAFLDNNIAAKRKYMGQVVEITGKVWGLEKAESPKEQSIVLIKPYENVPGIDYLDGFSCMWNKKFEDQLDTLNQDQRVTIRGTVTKHPNTGGIRIENCELVK